MLSGKRATALAGVLIAAFFLQILFASRLKSPVFDETAHIAGGLSYVLTGEFNINPEHPPLLKELSGLSMLAGGVRWPNYPLAQRALAEGGMFEWPAGNLVLATNGPDNVLFWARLPFLVISSLLGVLLYVWGRRMVGTGAALGALFLYVLDPTVLAHGYLVTTDVGLSAFTMLFLFALWHYLRRPGLRRAAWCGAALGAVLLTKFSAVFLLPISGLFLLAALRWPAEEAGDPAHAPSDTASAQPIRAVGRNDLCPCGSKKRYKNCHGARGSAGVLPAAIGRPRVVAFAGACAVMALLAVAMMTLCYVSPAGVSQYIDGLRQVNANHKAGYSFFMAGQMAPRFDSYFAVAYLLKEPLASVILAGIGLFVLLRNRAVGLLRKLFLLFPPLVMFAAYSIWADDLGVRYIIPVLPFACLLGGLGLEAMIRRGAMWSRALAGVLCVWMVVAAIGIYPDHLSYFNEMAALLQDPRQIGWDGGTRCGPLWLDDSNVDWGQGLKQLKVWLDQNAKGRTIRLAYFGSFPPEGYGISSEPVASEALAHVPAPGLYVLSAFTVARLPLLAGRPVPGVGTWVQTTRPTAIVGHAFYVYDIPGTTAPVR